MKKFRPALKHFFFPPEGSPLWLRILPYAILGLITLVIIISGVYTWEYTNSSAFCGTACHTMPPEYTSYLQSPHARIQCVECHIGRDVISERVTRKAGDIKHIIATIFKTYEYPIQAYDLRPSQFTCERCHFPEKFSDDSLRDIKHFTSDQANTPTDILLILKTGGGSKRQGLGLGIHWHIENKVYYLATDLLQQSIPFIRVVKDDGSTKEYVDINAQLDPKTIKEKQLVQMDCITCHNRITHLVMQPEDSVDQLLSNNLISPTIPEIRGKAVEVLRQPYATTQEAIMGIANLESYYTQNYPDFLSQNTDLVKQAIKEIQAIYTQSVFPEQKSDWNSHPNNVGHQYFPGCFRCHDGKHVDAQGEAIRLECNLCHSIPVVTGPDQLVTNIEIPRGSEPQTHKNPNWINLHHNAFDATCSNCHNTADAGGTSNTSFCSNSACHGTVFQFAGFDAPGLRELLQSQLPPTPTPSPTATPNVLTPTAPPNALTYNAVIGPLLTGRCGKCHGANGIKGLDVTTYASLLKGGQDGPVIIPSDPQNSLLVKIQSAGQPHFGQLTPDELTQVIQWITSGAPEK